MTAYAHFLTVVAIASLVFSGCGEDDGIQTAAPVFETAACAMPIPDGQDPAHVTCGFVSVPENRARNSRQIKLAVAVLHATGPAPAPDPIIHLGPGLGPILDGLMQTFTADFAAPLQRARDLVFFDMRGSGRSTPSLACSEVLGVTEVYAEEQSVEADAARDIADLLACHDRLAGDGVDFADYTSAGIAADARDVLRALGYQQWNVYGWSQSTRIAQVLMRDSPAGEVRSVVLDSPIPIQRAHLAEYPANLERSLGLLVADCAADAGCDQAFPNLAQTVAAIAPARNASPVIVEPVDPATGQPFRVVVTGDRLVILLANAMQDTTLVTFIPLLAQQLVRGESSLLSVGLAGFAGAARGDAMSQSVLCQDQVPLMTAEVLARAAEGVDPDIAHALRAGFIATVIGPCSGWTGVTPITAPPPAVASSLATLILSGEYDPATPPAYAHEVAATLSASVVVEFRGHSHGELYVIDAPPGQTSCAMAITAQFIADPESDLDTSCAPALPPHFVGS